MEGLNQAGGKIVVIGDGACGKTCLLEVFKKNLFPAEYIPTIIDNFIKDVNVDGEDVALCIWDTAGQEEYDAVRPASYSDTDLVFLCYSVERKEMLSNMGSKWMPEIRNYCPDAGTFLVGLKVDLRDGSGNMTSTEEGQAMQKKLGAIDFFECSAKENTGVAELFHAAAKWIKDNKNHEAKRKRWYCCYCC